MDHSLHPQVRVPIPAGMEAHSWKESVELQSKAPLDRKQSSIRDLNRRTTEGFQSPKKRGDRLS